MYNLQVRLCGLEKHQSFRDSSKDVKLFSTPVEMLEESDIEALMGGLKALAVSRTFGALTEKQDPPSLFLS